MEIFLLAALVNLVTAVLNLTVVMMNNRKQKKPSSGPAKKASKKHQGD